MSLLPDIWNSEKTISYFPDWSKPEEETGHLWFDAPLDIGGVTEVGLYLHAGAIADAPDCNVSFELGIRSPKSKRRVPIARVDWRALSGGPATPNRGSSKWKGQRVPDTHFHHFDLNYLPSEQRMRNGNLKFARPISEQLQSFESLRAYVGKEFRINNINIVKPPEWVYDLFS